MQLSDLRPAHRNVSARLGAAVLTVLGATHARAAPSYDDRTEVDAAVLQYRESAGRVSTTEAVVHVRKNAYNGSSMGLKLTFDTLSGGSPNGALPSRLVQTFARPSGHSLSAGSSSPVQTYTTASGRRISSGGDESHSGPYRVAAGALPLDDSFRDQRAAVGLEWNGPLGPLTTLALGASYSHEYDFQSASVSATIAQDSSDKNTTLTAGINVEADRINPIGGAPVPMSDYALFSKGGNKSRNVADLLLGVSQVMSRRWITQLNFSLDKSSGYQNDPYKILSALDAAGNTLGYVYENRPAQRSRKSLYWGHKIALDHDTVDIAFRHMSDDWGITSNTLDARYRWTLPGGAYFEPHVRQYRQSAADFYRLYLLQGEPLLSYASADPRLGRFTARTVGLKWATPLGRKSEFSVRFERYGQTGKVTAAVPAALQGLDLYPGLKATVLQLGLKMPF
jgi:hypothetical protein